jgi:predicted SnoaL-like aldol condensation-catalyzing enzyme
LFCRASYRENRTRFFRKHSSAPTFGVAEWFTEGFRFHDPSRPDFPTGYAGAAALLERFKVLSPPIRREIVDAIDENDRVAVRFLTSATCQNEPVTVSSIAIHRCRDGRIAEDWGVKVPGRWARRVAKLRRFRDDTASCLHRAKKTAGRRARCVDRFSRVAIRTGG